MHEWHALKVPDDEVSHTWPCFVQAYFDVQERHDPFRRSLGGDTNAIEALCMVSVL